MEITNEIKAKVFAQYLGQIILCNQNFTLWHDDEGQGITDYKKGDIVNYDLLSLDVRPFFEYVPSIILKLKPLSAITDEDAIEVAKLLFINPVHEWKVLRYEKHIYFLDVKSIQNLETCSIEYNVNIFWLAHSIKGSHQIIGHEDKIPFLLSESYNTVYQFLQSKGYDLPHYLLNGKTLKECGLAIHE